MKNILVGAFMLFINTINAQKTDPAISFSSINQAGLLTGQYGEALTLQSVNGIRKDKWFAGLGAGIDFYAQRSIPLFVRVQYEFSSKPNRPFVYADAGANFRWLNQENVYKTDYEYNPGLYYAFGIGYKLKAFTNAGFLISAGYSYKQMSETVPAYWLSAWPVQEQNMIKYNYQFRRIEIKLGLQL